MNYTILAEVCNLWRNYDDIQDSWDSVLSILDWFFANQDVLQPVAGPGHWNDPDMVRLGGGCTDLGQGWGSPGIPFWVQGEGCNKPFTAQVYLLSSSGVLVLPCTAWGEDNGEVKGFRECV